MILKCFGSCRWQLTQITTGSLITNQQPSLLTPPSFSAVVHTLISPFRLEILWFLLVYISWFSSDLPGWSLLLPAAFFCLPSAFDIFFFTLSSRNHTYTRFPRFTVNCKLYGQFLNLCLAPFISFSFLSSIPVWLVVCWNFLSRDSIFTLT